MNPEKKIWNSAAIKYSKKVEEKNSSGFLIREKCLNPYFFKSLGDVNNKKILDYGCGNGWLCRYLKDHGASIEGADISEEFIKIAKHKFPDIPFHVVEEKNYYKKNSFEIVVCNLVLHVTKEYSEVIREIYKILKPGGRAILTIMHPQFWKEEQIDLKKDKEILDVIVEKTILVKYYRRSPRIYESEFEKIGFILVDKKECKAIDPMPKKLEKYNKNPYFLLWELKKQDG